MCCIIPDFRLQYCWPASYFQKLRLYLKERCWNDIIPCGTGSFCCCQRLMWKSLSCATDVHRWWTLLWKNDHFPCFGWYCFGRTFQASVGEPMMKFSSAGSLSWPELTRIPVMSICFSRLLTVQQIPGRMPWKSANPEIWNLMSPSAISAPDS